MKLSELSKVLESQFLALIDLPNSGTKTNRNTYDIQEFTVKVFVKMERKNLEEGQNNLAQLSNMGYEICEAEKCCVDVATVQIVPANDQVHKVVVEYFRKVTPAFLNVEEFRQFDEVSIDGIKI